MHFKGTILFEISLLLGCIYAQLPYLNSQLPRFWGTPNQPATFNSWNRPPAQSVNSMNGQQPRTQDDYSPKQTHEDEMEIKATTISKTKTHDPTPPQSASPPASSPLSPSSSSSLSTPTPTPTRITTSFNEFNRKLLNILGPPFSRTNMIYSPISLQILLSFIYTGCEGETAQELRGALEIPVMPSDVARLIRRFLEQTKRQTTGQDFQLNMLNNMYYSNQLRVNDNFYRISKPYFEATIEAVNFKTPRPTAARINKMVADKTEQRIQDLVKPETLNAFTQAILVNAIFLKAKWEKPFSTSETQTEDFHVKQDQKVPVNMMYLENDFKVGDLSELNAKAIEIPFDSENLSMLLVLPNAIDGLESLEVALASSDLNSVSDKLRRQMVTLRMPSFEFEFDVDMTEALRRMGVSRLFSSNAQMNGLFGEQPVRVDGIQHKAYIKVNEGGVEAAAASFGKLTPLSVPFHMKQFVVNRPFVFAIRTPDAVYFMGHVTRPSYGGSSN